MTPLSLSLRARIGAVGLAVLLTGCPTGSDPGVDPGSASGEAGAEGGTTADAGPAADAGPTADAGADSTAPIACGLLTTLCKDGEKCGAAADCASSICSGGVCQAPGVADGVKNGDETGIDCGGSKAPACADGKGCLVVTDCISGVCTSGTCQVPTATDGVRNGDETGVDCGGSKAPRCPAGQGCLTDADCNQLKCDPAQKKCLAASHTDGIKNDGETGIDCGGAAPTKCPTGQGCLTTADCDLALCDVAGTKLCLAPTHADGITNLGETGIDCGGAALPTKCATGQGCAGNADCNNVLCTVALVCDSPTNSDLLMNGTETDIDCGGGAPTNAPGCAVGKSCLVDVDCGSKACNYAKKCVESPSCKVQRGGDTCGPNGNESCCKSLTNNDPDAAKRVNLDKYNITAGRFRQFVQSLGPAGNMRAWLAANTPAGWPANWTAMLPTMLDNGGTDPDFTGIYQELGPNVHPPASVGANEGCFIDNFGARTYRLPDAVNTRMSDPQYYTQAFLDDRSLNCVPVPMLAAFCAWDGGKLATKEQIDVAWGAGTYPWGADAPAGYRYAYDVDPMGAAGFEEAFGGFQAAPIVVGPFLLTAFYADYNYNYWGGAAKAGTPAAETYAGKSCTVLEGALGKCAWRDYSIYISPPGRFPTGNSATGHADLAGNVFNGTYPKQPNVSDTYGSADSAGSANGTNAHWSRSGSWQGHNIPWTAKKSWLEVPASYKYWAMGGRCVH